MKTQNQIRKAFWGAHPEYTRRPSKTQNDYPTDVRCAFSDYVDALARGREISEALANRVTL